LQELKASSDRGKPPNFDGVRRKYLAQLANSTKRAVILYAAKFTQPTPGLTTELVAIADEDLQGLMEVVHGLDQPDLDLILHSPGGSLEAAEAFVLYLRSKFRHIRVVVPQMAMSAATMVACAADVLVLGKHSFLGPIDPQVRITTPLGERIVPAQAILEQFEQAKEECQDPAKLGAWFPMLNQYGPDLLVQCRNTSRLAQELVQGWLECYMFAGDEARAAKAKDIAGWLAKHGEHKVHGRHLSRSKLQGKGLRMQPLEEDAALQDLVLSAFHATTHTFDGTPAVKIIENHLGKAFIKQFRFLLPPAPSPLPRDLGELDVPV
jgi:hypothetical protein